MTGTVLKERIKAGQYMQNLAETIPDKTTWILLTYRLNWIPLPAIKKIGTKYRHLGGGIAIRKSDPRAQMDFSRKLPYERIIFY